MKRKKPMRRTGFKRGPVAGVATTIVLDHFLPREHRTEVGGISMVTFTKRTPMRRRSKKMEAVYAGDADTEGRRAFVARILKERPLCQACELIATTPGNLSCARPHASVDVHEKLARSAGGSILDDDNVLAVCRWAHDWIGNHPREALRLGLRRSRYAGRNT